MGTVAAFPAKQKDEDPHIAGEARCIACSHEWASVAPVGSVWLECPSCKTSKGLMKYACERTGLEWHCNCGNTLFHATPDGFYCPNCGSWQTGF